MTDTRPVDTGTDRELARELARKRIEKRRGLQGALVGYVVVNAFLIGVWALTGGGYFWPAWILAAWGVGLLLGLWDYLRGQITERDVDEEIERMHRHAALP